jgi:hypothetical protein
VSEAYEPDWGKLALEVEERRRRIFREAQRIGPPFRRRKQDEELTPQAALRDPLVEPEVQQIEAQAGEPIEGFWEKFRQKAKESLCRPDGKLRRQWDKFEDLATTDLVKRSAGWLTALGFGTQSILLPMAVAGSVLLLYLLGHIGIQVVCDDDEQPPTPEA